MKPTRSGPTWVTMVSRLRRSTPSQGRLFAIFLFLLRDVGLLLGFNLSRNPRRADIAVLVYLVVLYTVLPGIFYALDAAVLTAFFWP